MAPLSNLGERELRKLGSAWQFAYCVRVVWLFVFGVIRPDVYFVVAFILVLFFSEVMKTVLVSKLCKKR